MSLSKEVIHKLAEEQRKQAIEQYTNEALKNEKLPPEEKIKLVELNQENRLSIITRVQKHTLENLFKKKPDSFFTSKYHYDWWAFPMHVPLAWNWPKRNYDASINPEEAATLLADDSFVATYLSCISLYLDALEKHGWNNYPVRYARMLNSIALFLDVAEGRVIKSAEHSLVDEAKRSLDFAKQYLLKDNSQYELFNRGFQLVKQELKKQPLQEDMDQSLKP